MTSIARLCVAYRYLKKAGSVRVIIDRDETLKARAKFNLFPDMIVGRFEGSIALYRAFDGEELQRVLQGGKLTGGGYSAAPERAYGASWGHNINQVIQAFNNLRGTRIGTDLYLAKIDGFDHQFAHLDPKLGFDPAGPPEQAAPFQADTCNLGLGCSIMVGTSDVDAFYKVDSSGQINQLSIADLKKEQVTTPQPEPKPEPPKPPERIRGDFTIKPKDRFTVEKGSRRIGINKGNHGVIKDVFQLSTDLEEGLRIVYVQMAFVWPVKGSPTKTLHAMHPNRLKDFQYGVPLRNDRGDKILISKRRR